MSKELGIDEAIEAALRTPQQWEADFLAYVDALEADREWDRREDV